MEKISEKYDIKSNDIVTVTEMNHITEVQYLKSKTPAGTCPIKRLDADRYMLTETGEIKEYVKSETRADNAESLRQTMKRLRYLINNNFTGARNELFLTLTYAENMMDTKRLYRDFEVFMKRLKRHFKGKNVKYLAVCEPQNRGAWHMHVLLKIEKEKNLFLQNELIESLWEQGFVSVKRLQKDVNNLGAYLTSYLTDIEIPDSSENRNIGEIKLVEEGGKEVPKRIVKGARLHFYPPNFNFYRSSRNCKKPLRRRMKYSSILRKRLGEKVYENTTVIVDKTVDFNDDKFEENYSGKVINRIKIEVYNCFDRNQLFLENS